MIRVTHLDQRELVLNCDLIEAVEAHPDTTIRLVTGRSHVVREGVDEVLARILAWRSSVHGVPGAARPSPVSLPPLVTALAMAEEELEVPA